MSILNTVGQFASSFAPFLDHLLFSRTSTGLASWTVGQIDTTYEPLEPAPKGFTLVFFFFSPIFEYLVFNYAENHYAKALEKFLRYQHLMLISAELGSLTLDTQSVSQNNFIKYKYPLRISSNGTATFTFIDYLYAYTCLTTAQCIGSTVGSFGSFFSGTFGQLAQAAGQIIGGLSGESGLHSVVRPVFETWFDLFVPFNRQIFLAQRALTNPPMGGSEERYIQLPEDTLKQYNAYSKILLQSDKLTTLLIYQPDIVYKANALIVQVGPDYNASVVNAYYIVGLYPTNYPVLNHDYQSSGLETISITFSYDYIFTGRDVLDLAQQLVNTPLNVLKPMLAATTLGSLTSNIVSKIKQLVSNKKQPQSTEELSISCFKSKISQAPIYSGKIQNLVSGVTSLLSPGVF